MAETFPGILAIFNNVAPGREAEFEEWFQHEHLAERIAVPGFLLGRRHEAVSGEPRYFNFYLTQSAMVLKSDAYLERLDHPTPMTRTIMSEIFKDMIRTVCHRTVQLGAMRGMATVTLRFAERLDQNALKAAIEDLMRDKAVACGEIWSAVDASDSGVRGGAPARRRSQGRRVSLCRDAACGGRREDCAEPVEPVSAGDRRRLSPALRDQVRLGREFNKIRRPLFLQMRKFCVAVCMSAGGRHPTAEYWIRRKSRQPRRPLRNIAGTADFWLALGETLRRSSPFITWYDVDCWHSDFKKKRLDGFDNL